MVAGLGLALVQAVLGAGAPAPVQLARRLHPVGAAAAVASLVASTGGVAGALAVPWFAVCLCAAAGGLMLAWHLRDPVRLGARAVRSRLVVGTLSAGLVYLAVGGGWLVVSRLGLRPLDLSTDVVRMTALHFHYAGFGLPVLAAIGMAAVDWYASRLALAIGCAAAVVGPPVVAAGFAFDSALGQVGGAVIMTVAAWGVGFGTFLLSTSTSALGAAPTRGGGKVRWGGRALLIVSSLSPIVPMVLAIQWALAQHTGLPALDVDDMAATHGLLNGVGFVMAGLSGWLLTGAVTAPAARIAEVGT